MTFQPLSENQPHRTMINNDNRASTAATDSHGSTPQTKENQIYTEPNPKRSKREGGEVPKR